MSTSRMKVDLVLDNRSMASTSSSTVGDGSSVNASASLTPNTAPSLVSEGSNDDTSAEPTASEIAITLLGKDFGRLPKETVIKILEFAVIAKSSIKPVQVCDGSNKFVLGPATKIPGTVAQAAAVITKDRWVSKSKSKLAMPHLMATCKTFYNLLNESAAFYRLNKFEFSDGMNMLRYLSSITPARVKDLRDIAVVYKGRQYGTADFEQACVLLSTCKELQNLTISIDVSWGLNRQVLEDSLQYVRCGNLVIPPFTTLELLGQVPLGGGGPIAEDQIANKLRSITSGPPVPPLPEGNLVKARLASGVYIHGNGRIANETRPGLISSRTRAGRAKLATVTSDGIPQQHAKPKLDQYGQLNWACYNIIKHKQCVDPDTQQTVVKFKVNWAEKGTPANLSWETLELLLTQNVRGAYSTFWQLNNYYNTRRLWGKIDGAKEMYDAAVERLNLEKSEVEKKTKRNQPNNIWVKRFAAAVKQHEKYLEQAAAEAEYIAGFAERRAAKAERAAAKAQKTTKKRKASSGAAVANKKRNSGGG